MKRILPLVIMLICSVPSVCFSAESKTVQPSVNDFTDTILLDDYRGRDGVWISLDENGNIFIKKDQNTVLYKGKISFIIHGDYRGSYDVFVAVIDFSEDHYGFDAVNSCVIRSDEPAISFVIGKYISGEGDPCSLTFFELDNDFGCRLMKSFPEMKSEVLYLSSRGVTGEWPEYLDETNDSAKTQESNK